MPASLSCHPPLTSSPCQGDESTREVTKDVGSEQGWVQQGAPDQEFRAWEQLSIPPVPAPARAARLSSLHE